MKIKNCVLVLAFFFGAPCAARADVVAVPIGGDGYHAQWSPSSGAVHYTMLGASTSYNAASAVGSRDSYRVSLWMIPMGATISAVEITPRLATNGLAGTSSADVFYRWNGADAASAGGYSLSSASPVVMAPATFGNLALVRNTASTLEVGVVLSSGTAGARVSSMAVRITYTSAGAFNAPSNLSASTAPGRVELSWTSNTGGSETGFRVERSLASETTFSFLANVGAGVTAYADQSGAAGVAYTYQIVAFNMTTGQQSAPSNRATATVVAVADPGGGTGGPIEVAITIDDFTQSGPATPGITREQTFMEIRDVLLAHDVPGAYGLVNASSVVAGHRALLQAWLDAGYSLGNHTFSHADSWTLSTDAFVADILAGEPLLEEMYGPGHEAEWKVFRYPYAHRGANYAARAQLAQFLADRGYRTAWTTVNWGDWMYASAYLRCDNSTEVDNLIHSQLAAAGANLDWAVMASQQLFGRPIKHILTIHVTGFTAVMMDDLLTYLESRNVRFISFDEAIADPVYTTEPPLLTTFEGDLLQQVRITRNATGIPPPPVVPNLYEICY